MSMIKKGVMAWLTLLIAFSMSAAQEYGGRQTITSIKAMDEEIAVSSINTGGAVYMVWNLKTLMGEPVVSSKGLVIIPDQSVYQVTYKDEIYKVPGEIVKKIKPVSVTVKAQMSPTLFVNFDLGAMGDTYFGSAVLVPYLSTEDKEKYFSFNVSGSPRWDALFHDHLGLSSPYLSEEEAKALFMKGIEIIPLGSYVEAEFDLNPIKNWIENRAVIHEKTAKIKENPFKKFEKMEIETSVEELEKIDADIRAFIIDRCGGYYTSVRVSGSGFHLTAEYIGETSEERKQRKKREKVSARKREERLRKAKIEVRNELSTLQRNWKEKRVEIWSECRAYFMKKYGLQYPMEALDTLLEKNFTSLKPFEAVYTIPYNR